MDHEQMSLEPQMVPLESIQPNPYQPRTDEDMAVIVEIAANIHRNGLLQIPSARAVNGHYELVFGHTRMAAFALLAGAGIPDQGISPDGRFAEMPLYIRELDDRQMFEMAVAENIKRRDLNAIELAASMKRYMVEFQASSRDAAELFGISDATVRGTVRLLNLPAAVQQKIAAGEITQGEARKLLVFARLDSKATVKIAERVAGGYGIDRAIQDAINNRKDVVVLSPAWKKGEEPLAGTGLWPLSLAPDKFPAKYFTELTAKSVASALEIDAKQSRDFLGALQQTEYTDLIEQFPDDADQIERTAHLLTPPACSACPFHMIVSEAHLCGFKACFARKSKAWMSADLARLSKKMGIAIYDPAADGKPVVPLGDGWGDNVKANDQLVKEQNAGLRLAVHRDDYWSHRWTESANAQVIAVGELAKSFLEAREDKKENNGNHEEMRWKYEEERKRRQATEKFYAEQVTTRFAVAFKGIDNLAALCALTGSRLPKDAAKRADMLAALRVELAARALRNETYSGPAMKGPVAFAKHIKKIGVTWGVELPDDFIEIARNYEPVSTETGKGVSVETPRRKKPAKDAEQ